MGRGSAPLLTQEAVDLSATAQKERETHHVTDTDKSISRISVTLAGGKVLDITPRSGHSRIFAIDLGDGFVQVTAGKRPVLAQLFTAIVQQTPEFIPFATAVAMKRRLERITDDTFRDLPIEGNA